MDEINKNLETLHMTGEKDSDAEKETQSFTAQGSDQEPDQAHSHQKYMALTKKNREMKLMIESLQHQVNQIQEQHQQEINTSRRLRHQRDQYRSTAKDLANQVLRLQQHQQEEQFYDSDGEDLQMPKKKKSTSAETAPTSQTSYTRNTLFQEGKNKHYPDVPYFYGDRTQWESWQLHLKAKFRASGYLYSTPQLRIDYIRDHCKFTAFNVIKSRCTKSSINPYVTPKEIL